MAEFESCLNRPVGIMCTSMEMREALELGIQGGTDFTSEDVLNNIARSPRWDGYICVSEDPTKCPGNPRKEEVNLDLAILERV